MFLIHALLKFIIHKTHKTKTNADISVPCLAATVQEEAGDDDAVCQITSERFQKSLQRHLSLYVTPQRCALKLSPFSHHFPSTSTF